MFNLDNWQKGNITSGEFLDKVEDELLPFLDALARQACADGCPSRVHFMVEQQRKVVRVMRDIRHRLPDQHRH